MWPGSVVGTPFYHASLQHHSEMRAPFVVAFAVLMASSLMAQSTAITVDGRFDDWSPVLTMHNDSDAPSSGINLLSMQVTNDETNLYVRLNVESEIDLLDDLVPQTIRLYIDGDNNASTGNAAQTGYGAELQVRFDTRTVTEYFGASSNVSWSTLDLVPLPTTTSTSFEIAIARSAKPDGTNFLFTSSTIKILFRETDSGDAMPNTGSTFSYTFDEAPVPPVVPIPMTRVQAADLRVLAWNVLGDGITNPSLQGQYQRMLAAMDPDVIGFSECVTSTATAIKTRLDTWLPIGGAGWQVAKDDFDMVIAARWPIMQSWPALTRQFAAFIDLPATLPHDLLFTASHLHCCTADANRQNEADEYVRFVQDAMYPGGAFTLPENTPMIYAGDLNSVGYQQQLTTLLTGDIQNNATYGPDGPMDWDGTAASACEALHTHARLAYTWRSNTSAYPSGRLDHMFYSDAVIELRKSFLLRTSIMPPTALSANGLNPTDTESASDHYPVVGDFFFPTAAPSIAAKCFLEGPYDATLGLMHDSLRVRGLIPAQEPFSALGLAPMNSYATLNPNLLNVPGPDAIVDWVVIELRDQSSPGSVVERRCALLQRDGDVVSTDGGSPVPMASPAGAYHVAIRHRNHLGAMSAAAINLSGAITVDLTTSATATFGSEARKNSGVVELLWAGNALLDGVLRYVGNNNDRDPILLAIGGSVPTASLAGYESEDINMNGEVRYVGQGNDRDPILVNIGGSVPTNTRIEQLP